MSCEDFNCHFESRLWILKGACLILDRRTAFTNYITEIFVARNFNTYPLITTTFFTFIKALFLGFVVLRSNFV